jgi:hypothetical protein
LVVLFITTASLAEAEKRADVAATPKGFFEVSLQLALNKWDGTKKKAKIGRGGMPFDRLRDDFPIMPPQTGLEIILKAVFLQRFRAAGAWAGKFDGVPHKYLRPWEWRRAGGEEARLIIKRRFRNAARKQLGRFRAALGGVEALRPMGKDLSCKWECSRTNFGALKNHHCLCHRLCRCGAGGAY